ncbi:MAG: homoserine dehydrogenase [Oscillospiraceae bacterium]|nr:homoserine dehydrogenase [Oscillospiraceae bacterium]
MKAALLGFGVVGGGVYTMLQEHPGWEVAYVLDKREFPELGEKLVHSIDTIVNDPAVDVVVEMMGGTKPAFDFVAAALKAGKHVVTSNKALIAAYYNELTALARENGVALRCTAAVGGGIPWLTSLERACSVDTIESISGIMNGTTNYILDVMTREGKEFAGVLKNAQELGYAEADPTADIDGWDIRRKLVISSNIAYGISIQEEDIPMSGIRGITAEDIAAFTEAGLVCRMIASSARTAEGISATVEPMLLPKGAPEAAVPLNYNRISYVGERLGIQAFFGQGAGRYPTAANCVRDCLDIEAGKRSFYADKAVPTTIRNEGSLRRYYVRANDAAAFADVAESKLGCGIVTRAIPVPEMYARAEKCSFFAALREE